MKELLHTLICPAGFHLDNSELDSLAHHLRLYASSMQRKGICPNCQIPSRRIHSHYERSAADLPVGEYRVTLKLRVRKFLCCEKTCSRRVFTERFPAVLKPWARRTVRLSTQQTAIGVAVGGLPGERLSTWLGIPLGHNALLRLVRQLPTVSLSSPRIVGIDDWAQCRRNRYGTVVIDLERHRLIALLADRESTTVAQWLREHPTIEVISRDRFNAYIEGASNGAPQATQVADRFHLLRNVADALRKVFDQHAKCIAELDQRRRQARQRSDCPMPSLATITPIGTATATEQSQHRRARRLARYERVWQLHRQGFSRAAIAREIGIHRNTVDKFLRSARFPERQARAQRSSVLDPFKAYLLQRWQSGYRNAMQLDRKSVV